MEIIGIAIVFLSLVYALLTEPFVTNCGWKEIDSDRFGLCIILFLIGAVMALYPVIKRDKSNNTESKVEIQYVENKLIDTIYVFKCPNK